MDKFGSIQWVINSLDNDLMPRGTHEKHKMDSIRADEKISWCPTCKKKWNIFEGVLWSSLDIRLWKEKKCPNCDSPAK